MQPGRAARLSWQDARHRRFRLARALARQAQHGRGVRPPLLAVNQRAPAARQRQRARFTRRRRRPGRGAGGQAAMTPRQAPPHLGRRPRYLFGRASLFQRLSVAHTRFGRTALGQACWQSRRCRHRAASSRGHGAGPRARPSPTHRSALQRAHAGQGAKGTTVASRARSRAAAQVGESAPRLLARPALIWAARVIAVRQRQSAATGLVGLAAGSTCSLPRPFADGGERSAARRAGRFEAVATREGALSGYDELLEAIETSSASAELPKSCAPASARATLRRRARWASCAPPSATSSCATRA